MSSPFQRFGAFTGVSGGDCRVQIGGKGKKNILAVTASYQRTAVAAPEDSFQGRLVIVEGQLGGPVSALGPPPADYPVNANFDGQKILFDVRFSGVGPHPFFYPIAQQEGSPQSDEDSTVNIVLCVGRDALNNAYIPTLTVSGQTSFSSSGGAFA